ncbi:hypothetical protein LSH36_639g01048 [Paralvinella palmiformis]|uniref:Uncharacterized protein n=1 Tax=Paralvinella palmiformis TaxID=53620 RepID=A0AAD9MVV1_9ANNE|nr:hypothetical protein LSH36_639g01048 [Paralvinella palmiformis]
MDALFACTKCHSRHPFEELSDGKQLCKSCRNNYPTVKCTYCRAEFQQEDPKPVNIVASLQHLLVTNVSVVPIVKKDMVHHRPVNNVDGKLLCWLCTMAYKRVLAKTKHKSSMSSSSSTSHFTKENRETKSENSSPAGAVRLKTSASTSSLSLLGSKHSKLLGSGSNNNKGSSSGSQLQIVFVNYFNNQSRNPLEPSKDKDTEKEKNEDRFSSSSSSSSGGKKRKSDGSDTK